MTPVSLHFDSRFVALNAINSAPVGVVYRQVTPLLKMYVPSKNGPLSSSGGVTWGPKHYVFSDGFLGYLGYLGGRSNSPSSKKSGGSFPVSQFLQYPMEQDVPDRTSRTGQAFQGHRDERLEKKGSKMVQRNSCLHWKVVE